MKFHFTLLLLFVLLSVSCDNKDCDCFDNSSQLRQCLETSESKSLEVITWNVKEFPVNGDTTIRGFSEMIALIDADLIALQEFSSGEALATLLGYLNGWDGIIESDGAQNLALLYKRSEITISGKIESLFKSNSYDFPRSPLLIRGRHSSGINFHLINVHLKCCDGEENISRRKAAIFKLKEFIDNTLQDEPVILLGDFNEAIPDIQSAGNIFLPIITDSLDYKITDKEIAAGDPSGWSFPSWPSHIDHIIITNELFGLYGKVRCLRIDSCYPSYFETISDHRPLMIQFSK